MTVATTGIERVDVRSLLDEGTHLIGGEWVPAVGSETLPVLDPSTQEVILHVPRGGAADVDAAVAAATAQRAVVQMPATDYPEADVRMAVIATEQGHAVEVVQVIG